jgi:DNA-binding NarL/FixJ family response regulator
MPETLQAPLSHTAPERPPHKLVLVDALNRDDGQDSGAISVLIAHGEQLGRAGLHALLDAEPDIAVAAFAADGEQALAVARQTCPDMLLIDRALPGIDALEVTACIAADPATSGIRILILGVAEEDEEVFSFLRAGASGFLTRDTEPAELVHASRLVAAGEAAFSASLVRRVIAELASQPDPRLPKPELLDELTAREREVMVLVARGLTNDQIAEHLVVSPATAKTHVSRAMCKLRARDRAQLVILAYECGLVAPRPRASALAPA